MARASSPFSEVTGCSCAIEPRHAAMKIAHKCLGRVLAVMDHVRGAVTINALSALKMLILEHLE